MNDLTALARKILTDEKNTCVLCSQDEVYRSTERGVKPLIGFLEMKKDFNGFSAADKTVGLGAAHLYILLGVKSLYANVISRGAKELLEGRGIAVFYGTEAPYIINRQGDGPCPIESAVAGITDSREALSTIRKTLQNLKNM